MQSRVTACGTVTVGSWPNDKIGEDTAMQVNFDQAFEVRPSMLVQLAALDAQSPAHKRIETWASDITRKGFRLHVRTWADSTVWMVKVSWIASANPAQVQFGSLSATDVECRTPMSTGSRNPPAPVQFARPFSCTPDVSLGWSAVDASGEANLCLLAESRDVCSRGFSLDCTSWCPGSIAWSTTLAWIACSSPAALQTGAESFGSGSGGLKEAPIKSDEDRYVNVVFPRAFDNAPSVALALVGAEASHHAPVRIDTFADNVTSRGFRLHVRSWQDSVTLFAKVAWVATPTTLNVTTGRIASHSPPSMYSIQGAALGEGAMGVTHKAKHILDGQIYAVKTSKHPFNHHEESFRKELANLARLPRHNNLLRYYTSVIEANRVHIVTECLDAFNFRELVPTPDGLFPVKHHPKVVHCWITQLFDGLAAMHSAGLTHRDLHSENVMVLRDPRDGKRPSQANDAVRIIDFGAGKGCSNSFAPCPMSQELGLFQYASPERRRGLEVNDRDDVWAAGCHLLELSTGKVICQRSDCGPDGNDFATSPAAIRRAIEECGNTCCRDTASYVLVSERQYRPSAAAAHCFALMALRPQLPSCKLVDVDWPSKRKRAVSTGTGGRRKRCRATRYYK